MKKLLAFAVCAAAFTGCDFVSSGSGGPAVPVSAIRLTNIPTQDLDDNGTAPDLRVEVQDITGRNYYRSDVMMDATTDSLTLDADFELASVGRSLFIVVYDADEDAPEAGDRDGRAEYDIIATSDQFSGEALDESAEAVVIIGSDSGMQAEIELER